MNQNKVLDVIISFINGLKNNYISSSEYGEENLSIDNCGYLLGQTLRHYVIPKDHYFVSKKAYDLWTKITNDSIFNYTYRDKITKNTSDGVFVDKYKGSQRKPYEENVKLSYGESFTFNDVFTDEHIVPINIIIKELVSLPNCDYSSVKEVLDKIYICKLLKEEDYKIANRSNRSINFMDVINEDYVKAGIEIINYKDIPEPKYNIEKEETFSSHKIKSSSIAKRKLQYDEEFVITSERKDYRRKSGFKAYNSKNEQIGIVFMCDDPRTPAFEYCELCVYKEYVNRYGEWHRIKSYGTRIKWNRLCEILSKQQSFRLFID